MIRYKKKISNNVGFPPGTPIYIGSQEILDKANLTLTNISEKAVMFITIVKENTKIN